MKGTSKVIMGATLVMVVTLAVVLVLIFVLLAELYCSLLHRRRHLQNSNSNNTIPATTTTQPTTARANASSPSHTTSHPQQQSPPFRSIYAQGVLQAPRSILLPAISCKEDKAGPRKHYSELHQVVQIQIQPRESNSIASPSPPPSFVSIAPSKPNHQHPLPMGKNPCHNDNKLCSGGEHLMYISNPIYENDESQGSGANTPFETPDTSPSRLEKVGSSEEDEATPCVTHSPPYTPPLTPMKKLPAEACSVSLRGARSLGTSCSDSRSNNGLSSSSGSPCTSPSW
ncbi:uncharacterized protein LOC109803460 [Cajanus cajan]|uniref:uncharacterized protein LOC109803460 n=1 Tax=Cajanus cajan TaxID=3821 RepID=UPI00098D9A23|nr:uncharacterized protein LOC109803460 [Cajanus cajan]